MDKPCNFNTNEEKIAGTTVKCILAYNDDILKDQLTFIVELSDEVDTEQPIDNAIYISPKFINGVIVEKTDNLQVRTVSINGRHFIFGGLREVLPR